jgi:hypothetical protein
MSQPRITRDDVTSLVGARRELGEEMEIAIAWIGIAAVNVTFSRRRPD